MPREISKSTMRNSDRAWVTLASDAAAYDLIAAHDEQLSNAARRFEWRCHSPVPNVGPNDLCRKFWLAVNSSFDGPVRDGEGCRG